ncbi:YadA-like family protein [Haemophilus aegyptius]|uniref:YadA-like family protein n=1 Tax=Haemophilus aegyptius TaxID=197575 RepID=UPI0002EBA4AB|nr:YadA-like family protein [Haemophilus aegyptius]UAK82249.1 YadA-like family protein [Haemophilus aegyptius]
MHTAFSAAHTGDKGSVPDAKASGVNATALGWNSTASGDGAVSIGHSSQASGNMTTALGTNAQATGKNATALGHNAHATANGTVSLGKDSKASGENSTVIGSASSVSGKDSVVIGHNSTVSANNSVAIGSNQTVTRDNTVSMGDRTVSNIRDGKELSDAVTVRQLNSTTQGVENRLTNKVNKLDKKLSAGVASAVAIANIPTVSVPGGAMIGIGVGNFRGQSSLAVGYTRSSDNNKVIFKATAGATSQKDYAVGAGIGFQW